MNPLIIFLVFLVTMVVPCVLLYRGSNSHLRRSSLRLYRELKTPREDIVTYLNEWMESGLAFNKNNATLLQFVIGAGAAGFGYLTEGEDAAILYGVMVAAIGMVCISFIPEKVDRESLWKIWQQVFQMAGKEGSEDVAFGLYWAAMNMEEAEAKQQAFQWAQDSMSHPRIKLMDRLLNEWGVGIEAVHRRQEELEEALSALANVDPAVNDKEIQWVSTRRVEGVAASVLDFVDEQKPFLPAPGRTFCERCRVRGDGLNLHHFYVAQCLTCEQWDALVPDIEGIIGVIGPLEKAGKVGQDYLVPLWDAKDDKAILAEVDTIKVVPGGNFNYDWAVAAVVENIQNRFPHLTHRLNFEVDPYLELSPNTLNIIQNH